MDNPTVNDIPVADDCIWTCGDGHANHVIDDICQICGMIKSNNRAEVVVPVDEKYPVAEKIVHDIDTIHERDNNSVQNVTNTHDVIDVDYVKNKSKRRKVENINAVSSTSSGTAYAITKTVIDKWTIDIPNAFPLSVDDDELSQLLDACKTCSWVKIIDLVEVFRPIRSATPINVGVP